MLAKTAAGDHDDAVPNVAIQGALSK